MSNPWNERRRKKMVSFGTETRIERIDGIDVECPVIVQKTWWELDGYQEPRQAAGGRF